MTERAEPTFSLDDPAPITRDDAACAIAWRVDDHEVIEVYVDPALGDRTREICDTVEALAAAHADLDALTEAIDTYADGQALSASVYEPDGPGRGVVAIAFTIG